MSTPNNFKGVGNTPESGRESWSHRVLTSRNTGKVALAAVAGGFVAGMLTMPNHKVETTVTHDAPAMEQFINQSTPTTLESGTKLTAECRRTDGTIVASEPDAAIYTLYAIDPAMLHAAGETPNASGAWIGSLVECGQ